MAKHGAARLKTYLDAHNNKMGQLIAEGFALADELEVDRVLDGVPFLEIKGDIHLQGNLRMTVYKRLRIWERKGVPYVKTVTYAYNLVLSGVGNIFRYDNMHAHPGHASEHHKHEYEPPGERKQLTEITDEEDWPTLGEALDEARNYLDWWQKYGSDVAKEETPEMVADDY